MLLEYTLYLFTKGQFPLVTGKIVGIYFVQVIELSWIDHRSPTKHTTTVRSSFCPLHVVWRQISSMIVNDSLAPNWAPCCVGLYKRTGRYVGTGEAFLHYIPGRQHHFHGTEQQYIKHGHCSLLYYKHAVFTKQMNIPKTGLHVNHWCVVTLPAVDTPAVTALGSSVEERVCILMV